MDIQLKVGGGGLTGNAARKRVGYTVNWPRQKDYEGLVVRAGERISTGERSVSVRMRS